MKLTLTVMAGAVALAGCGTTTSVPIDHEAACADPAFNRGDVASCKKRVAGIVEQALRNEPDDCAAEARCVTIGEADVIGDVDVDG